MAEVPDDKRREDQGPGDNPAQHPGVGPTMDRLFDDAIDQRSDANYRQQAAHPVEGSRLRILALRHEKPDADQGDDDDRRIDQKDGSPGVMAEEPAGDQRAKREAEKGARRRDADAAGTLP